MQAFRGGGKQDFKQLKSERKTNARILINLDHKWWLVWWPIRGLGAPGSGRTDLEPGYIEND